MEVANKSDGMTALIYSAQNGHDGCLRELLKAKVRNANTCPQMCALLRMVVYANDSTGEHCSHSVTI